MQKDFSHIIKFIPQLGPVADDKARALVYQEFMPACYEPDITDHDYHNTLEKAGLGGGGAWHADVEGLDLETTVALLTFILRADHFDDGALFVQFENGYLLRVLRRLAMLVEPSRRGSIGRESNIIAFWHEYDENGYLSNWYDSPFEFEGVKFRTSEHWMMWQKACMFWDSKKADEILKAPTPKEAKPLGREVSPFDSSKWDAASSQLVICGLRHKFAQNEELRNNLLSTGSSVLVEASPYDKVWGIGLQPDDPRVADPREWQGKNLLGRALMGVRADLRTLGRLGCEDWREVELESLQVWDMTLLELARNPVTRPAALAYAWSISALNSGPAPDARTALRWVSEFTVAEIEEMMNTNMGGGLPIAGWRELLDDLRFQAALGRL